MKKLINLIMHNKLPILFITGVLLIIGILLLFSIPEKIFPKATFPRILITIERGYAPIEDMEISIVKPLESSLMTVEGAKIVRSKISRGTAEIEIFFDWKINLSKAFQLAQAKISEISATFPPDTKITVKRMTTSAYPISGYALYSETGKHSMKDLRNIAEFQIKPLLSTIDGIYGVTILGGDIPEFLCELNPVKMREYNIDPLAVKKKISEINNVEFLGRIVKEKKLYLGFAPHILKTKRDIEGIIIARRGFKIIYLKDIAKIKETIQDQYFITTADWHRAVLFHILEQPQASSVRLSKIVDKKLNEIKKSLPNDIKISKWYDLASFVKKSIIGVFISILLGFIIISIIVLLFLRRIRFSIPIIIIMPVATVLTIIFIKIFNLSLNLMTLGGIAAGLGIIVDNAVVVVENIIRHKTKKEKSPVISASSEVIPPMIGATLTTVAAFIPIMFLTGLTGVFFKPMAITLASMVSVSLLLAIFVTPIITNQILPKSIKEEKDFLIPVKKFYTKIINTAINKRKMILIIMGFILIFSIFIFTKLKTGFLPKWDEGTIVFDYTLSPGTSLQEADKVIGRIEKILKNIPEIKAYSRRTGYGLAHPHDPNEGDILISLKDSRKRTTFEIMDYIEKKVRAIYPPLNVEENDDEEDEDEDISIKAGIDFEMFQVLPDRLGDLTGKQKQIVIKIYGNNFKILKIAGEKIKKKLLGIRGLKGIRLTVVEGEPEFIIKIKKSKAANLGLSSEQIGELTKIAIWGDVATKIKRGLRLINLKIRYPGKYRESIKNLKNLPVYSPLAGFIPLKVIADVKMRKGEDEIYHENGSLLVTVTGEVLGRDLGSTVKDIKRMLSKINLPFGTTATLSGEYESQISSFRELLIALFLAALLIFTILLFEFENYKPAIAVFLGTLFSFCLVVIGLWITGTEFNISSFAGLITVLGIVVNNGILLIDFTIRYEKDGNNTITSLIKAGEVRLRPILITNLTTIAGFLPIALNLTRGSEILAPFAITVIFGLFSSILFSLIVIPLFYYIMASVK